MIFRDSVENSILVDIITGNNTFKWNNKWGGDRHIASHLAQFLVSDSIMELGGDLSALVLPFAGSGHWPIFLKWSRLGYAFKKLFHFEQFLLIHPNFKEKIQ